MEQSQDCKSDQEGSNITTRDASVENSEGTESVKQSKDSPEENENTVTTNGQANEENCSQFMHKITQILRPISTSRVTNHCLVFPCCHVACAVDPADLVVRDGGLEELWHVEREGEEDDEEDVLQQATPHRSGVVQGLKQNKKEMKIFEPCLLNANYYLG